MIDSEFIECKWCKSKNIESLWVPASGAYFGGRVVRSYTDKQVKVCSDCGKVTINNMITGENLNEF